MHFRVPAGIPSFFLAAILSLNCYGQNFGGNPSSVKWRQINTDTVRVIFPAGDELRGQRVAANVHRLQRKYAHSIGDSIRKISIVLQNETLVSNGYVGLGPYRSEFYTTPPPNAFSLGAVNWTDVLSVHEFRHVQQYSNFNKGLSKFVSMILGQQGQAVANAIAVPNWFFEGDAVFNETKLTKQGRGTLPLFLGDYQSLYNAGRQYSYMKMRNGSYRQFVPDHYALGYLLVAYGRKQYGDDLWRKVTNDAARFEPALYPFQGAVKKYTGLSYRQFVHDAFAFYQEQWQSAKTAEPLWITGVSGNNVTDYKYPYTAPDGSLIVLKKSYNSVPAFYRIRAGQSEERIATRDISAPDDYFGFSNDRIVYTADRPDVRWGNRDYNVLKIHDLHSGEEKKIGGRGRYFTPDISHDGKLVTAVAQGRDTSKLVIFNTTNGNVIRTVQQAGEIYSYPKFGRDNAIVYWIVRNDKGEMGIKKTHVHSGSSETVLPFTNRIIGYLQVRGDTLLFSTTYGKRDELWGWVDRAGQENPYRLATYSTGLYQGTIDGNGRLTAAAFTANGYRLAALKPLWEPVRLKDELSTLYVPGAYRSEDHIALDSPGNHSYPVSVYRKGFGLLNIHSWRPYYDYPEYSFTLYGENVLNTFRSEIAYTYNANEGSHKIGYDGIYGGMYLQPVFGIGQTWQRSTFWSPDTTVNWNELNAYAGLRLPLNFSAGKQYRFLTLQTTFNTEKVNWTGVGKTLLRDANFNYIEAIAQYSGQIQQPVLHIYPAWGQSLRLQYRTLTGQYTAHQFLASGSLYLPGLLRNHNLVLNASFQERDTLNRYFFKNNFPFARGYRGVDFPRMWKLGLNYHFPICYPDWGFGQLVYFLRVRANAFYDHTIGKSIRTGRETAFNTVGAEVYFDTRWWNQQPVTFGIRYNRLLDKEYFGTTQPGVWEFILPVTLFK